MEKDNLRQSQIDARFLASNDNEFEDNLKEKCMEVFRMFDADGSGTIDASEFQELAFCLGETLTDEEAKAYIEKLDSDGNGVIDFNEFYAWWKSGSSNPLSQSSQTLPSEKLNVLKLKLRSQVFMRSIKNIFSRVNVTQEKVVKDSINIDIGLKVGDLSKLESADTGKMIFRLRSIEHPVGNKVVAKFLLNESTKPEDEQKLKDAIDVLTELVSLLAPESVPKIAFVDHPTLSKRRVMVVEVGFPAPPIPPINIPFDFTFEVKGNEKSKASLIRLHGNVSKSLVDFGAMMSKGKVPPAGFKVGKALNKISFQLEFDELDMEELSQSMMKQNAAMFTEQRLLATATDPNAQNLIKLTQAMQGDMKQFKDPLAVQKLLADMMRPFWNQPQAENPFADPLKEIYYNIADFVSGIESVTANVHTFQADWSLQLPNGKKLFEFLPTKEMLKPKPGEQKVAPPSDSLTVSIPPNSSGLYISTKLKYGYSDVTKVLIIDPNAPGLSPLESKVAKNTINFLTETGSPLIPLPNGAVQAEIGESFVPLPEYLKNNLYIPEDKIKQIATALVLSIVTLVDKNILVRELSINDFLYSEEKGELCLVTLDTATKGPKYSALGSDAILNVCNVSHDLVANGDVDMSVYGWHLGVILYQLVTGKHPCATDKTGEEGDKEMITKLKNITVNWESTDFIASPSSVQDLVERLLVKREYRLSLSAVKTHELFKQGEYVQTKSDPLGITFDAPSDWLPPFGDTLQIVVFAKYDPVQPELKDDQYLQMKCLGVIPESVRADKAPADYIKLYAKPFLRAFRLDSFVDFLKPVDINNSNCTALEFFLPEQAKLPGGEQERIMFLEDNAFHRLYWLSFNAGSSFPTDIWKKTQAKILETMKFTTTKDQLYIKWNRVASEDGKYSIAHPSGSSIVKEGSTLKFAFDEIIAKYLESADDLPTNSPYGSEYSPIPLKNQCDGYLLEYHLSKDKKHIRALAKRPNGHVLVVEQQKDPDGDNLEMFIAKHIRLSKYISFNDVQDSQDEFITFVSSPSFKVPSSDSIMTGGMTSCTFVNNQSNHLIIFDFASNLDDAREAANMMMSQTMETLNSFMANNDATKSNYVHNNVEWQGITVTEPTENAVSIVMIGVCFDKTTGMVGVCRVNSIIYSNYEEGKKNAIDTIKSIKMF